MNSKIIYREISGANEINDCFTLQQQIFNISDAESLPKVFFNLLTRSYPKVGFAIGAYDKGASMEKLIGYAVLIKQVEENSIYLMAIGVLPEYKNRNIGKNLMDKIKDIATNYNISNLYCVFEPLNSSLANFYFSKIGMQGSKYFIDSNNKPSEVPSDKLLIKWEFNSINQNNLEVMLEDYPIATYNNLINNNKLLLQIPSDFVGLEHNQAHKWRINTRKLFDEYVNIRGYQIANFYKKNSNGKKLTFYLLDKTYNP